MRLVAVLGAACFVVTAAQAESEMVLVPAGEVQPFFRRAGADDERVSVRAFEIDARPVSVRQFLEFVRAQASWRRSAVRRIHADEGYLKSWVDDLEPGPGVALDAPVTGVSWFAARAYAAWSGRRLPTQAEWEYVAAFPGRDGRVVTEVVLDWYARPGDAGSKTTPVFVNSLGVETLHGSIWEWVEDFNSGISGGDSRDREELDRARFCGSASLGAADRDDYAAFMRYAFRGSLKGRYTGRLLGFRCVRDVPGEETQP